MINLGGCIVRGEYYIILYAHTCLRLKNVLRLLRCDASQLHCLLRCDAHYTHCSFHSLLCFNTIHCKYATPLIFFNVNRIFFRFRAFYLFFIQILAVILHRNSKSSHVHRTLIALPSHTRTRVTAMRRSSNAKARSSSLAGCSRCAKARSRGRSGG